MSIYEAKTNKTEISNTKAQHIVKEEKTIDVITTSAVYNPVNDKIEYKPTRAPMVESIYDEILKYDHRFQNKMQYNHECKCPPNMIYICNGDCMFCRYHLTGLAVPCGIFQKDILKPKYRPCESERIENDTAKNNASAKKSKDSANENTAEERDCSSEGEMQKKHMFRTRKVNTEKSEVTLQSESYRIEESIETRECYEALYKFIAELEPEDQAICSRILDGVSIRKAAKELNLPASTYQGRYNRALKKLKPLLKDYYC